MIWFDFTQTVIVLLICQKTPDDALKFKKKKAREEEKAVAAQRKLTSDIKIQEDERIKSRFLSPIIKLRILLWPYNWIDCVTLKQKLKTLQSQTILKFINIKGSCLKLLHSLTWPKIYYEASPQTTPWQSRRVLLLLYSTI